MKKNPGRKEARRLMFNNRRKDSKAKQAMNARKMKKSAHNA